MKEKLKQYSGIILRISISLGLIFFAIVLAKYLNINEGLSIMLTFFIVGFIFGFEYIKMYYQWWIVEFKEAWDQKKKP